MIWLILLYHTFSIISYKVEQNFVEKTDLKGRISTQYYDYAALAEISKSGLFAGLIDSIEEYIQRDGIQPDRIISAEKKENNLILSVIENGEVVRNEQAKVDENRTVYSLYFEFMKANNYYGQSMQATRSNGMHR